jgi:hypothetical protein
MPDTRRRSGERRATSAMTPNPGVRRHAAFTAPQVRASFFVIAFRPGQVHVRQWTRSAAVCRS